MNFDVVDEAIKVSDYDAFLTARRLASEEGLLCGGSSGANVWCAMEIAKTCTKPTKIVTILPDGGLKYLSKIFNPVWLEEHGLFFEDSQKLGKEFHILESIREEIELSQKQ